MARYRAGIVGLNWITSDPAGAATNPVLGTATPSSHASALAAIPAVEVVAGCDIVPAACNLFLDRWIGVWPDVKTHSDFREMIDRERLDLICVATPDHLHHEVVIAAADAGAKVIFCEKPMAHRLDEADAMIAAIERNGVVVNVNHTRRWGPSYIAARESVRRGDIGALSQIVVQFGGPRAMLWRNHSHFLDLINYFADSDPIWTIAELEPGFETYGTEYRGDGGRSPELEPGLNAYIAYANGVRAVLCGMKRSVQQISVDLVGAEGRILANDQGAVRIVQSEDGLSTTPLNPSGTVRGIQAAILDLIHSYETGGEPQSPPREARKTVALIKAILASQTAGNTKVAIA